MDWTARGRDVDVLHACRVHVALYVPRLLDAGAAASSTSHRLSALSRCYRHLVEHDLIATNSAAAVRQPASTRTTPPPSGWTATRRARSSPPPTPTPARLRTAAAARLLLHLGLRVDELAAADVADLGHRVLTVTRKGGRRATVVLPPATSAALDAYIADRGTANPTVPGWPASDPRRRAPPAS